VANRRRADLAFVIALPPQGKARAHFKLCDHVDARTPLTPGGMRRPEDEARALQMTNRARVAEDARAATLAD
jgi:hypothetical protein